MSQWSEALQEHAAGKSVGDRCADIAAAFTYAVEFSLMVGAVSRRSRIAAMVESAGCLRRNVGEGTTIATFDRGVGSQ